MSDTQYSDILDDDTETEVQDQENGRNPLRDHAKKLEKEVAELRKFKAEQERASRESEVKQALSAAGLPAEAAKFAKDADDIGKWIEENRGLFGVAGETATTDDTTPKGNPSLTPEQIQELQATQIETQSQFQPGSREAARSRMTEAASKATSLEDLVSQINDSLSKPSGG